MSKVTDKLFHNVVCILCNLLSVNNAAKQLASYSYVATVDKCNHLICNKACIVHTLYCSLYIIAMPFTVESIVKFHVHLTSQLEQLQLQLYATVYGQASLVTKLQANQPLNKMTNWREYSYYINQLRFIMSDYSSYSSITNMLAIDLISQLPCKPYVFAHLSMHILQCFNSIDLSNQRS